MSLRRSPFHARGLVTTMALLALGPARGALGGSPQSAFNRPLGAFDAAAVERAKAGAARRLQKSECLKVLAEFTDAEGQTLEYTLGTWGMSAGEYVLTLPFQDGAAISRCGHAGIELVTHRGLRQVYVCPVGVGALNSRFSRTQIQTPALAEGMVIHEMLHTLGLGENPPSSFEITERVRTRCR
jgi:hypothetical protein